MSNEHEATDPDGEPAVTLAVSSTISGPSATRPSWYTGLSFVDRVVKLSNAEYEVHQIGVNWPHHIFVNQDFKVVGAE